MVMQPCYVVDLYSLHCPDAAAQSVCVAEITLGQCCWSHHFLG